jgi:hypothetical protein
MTLIWGLGWPQVFEIYLHAERSANFNQLIQHKKEMLEAPDFGLMD